MDNPTIVPNHNPALYGLTATIAGGEPRLFELPILAWAVTLNEPPLPIAAQGVPGYRIPVICDRSTGQCWYDDELGTDERVFFEKDLIEAAWERHNAQKKAVA